MFKWPCMMSFYEVFLNVESSSFKTENIVKVYIR